MNSLLGHTSKVDTLPLFYILSPLLSAIHLCEDRTHGVLRQELSQHHHHHQGTNDFLILTRSHPTNHEIA
jgi:hypothetical protein